MVVFEDLGAGESLEPIEPPEEPLLVIPEKLFVPKSKMAENGFGVERRDEAGFWGEARPNVTPILLRELIREEVNGLLFHAAREVGLVVILRKSSRWYLILEYIEIHISHKALINVKRSIISLLECPLVTF